MMNLFNQINLYINILIVLVSGNDKYEYQLFENFEKTKEIFISEIKSKELFQSLKRNLESQREIIRKHLNDNAFLIKNPNFNVEYPVDAFGMIKTSTVSNLVAATAFNKSIKDLGPTVSRLKNTTSNWPGPRQMSSAIDGMLHLFDTYKVNLNLTTRGVLEAVGLNDPISCHHGLRIDDMAMFASRSKEMQNYDDSIQYLQVVYELIRDFNKTDTYSYINDINKLKADVINLNNGYIKKGFKIGSNYKVTHFPVDINLKPIIKNKKKNKKKKFKIAYGMRASEAHFRNICADVSGSLAYAQGQKCHYLHRYDPYLRLGPIKLEVISNYPYIVIFHEIIMEDERKFLIEYSKPRLSASRHDVEDEIILPGQKTENSRQIIHKTVQCWIYDVDYNSTFAPARPDLPEDDLYHLDYANEDYEIRHEVLNKLSKRINIVTKLKTMGRWSSTPYQTTNYGLGGTCGTHIDPHGYIEGADLPDSRISLKRSGDMIATFMGWLEDVAAGGYTAFLHPEASIAVRPRKGSAAFWFSLDAKSHREQRTMHGGCPILMGSKWILNKWLYSFDNFLQYPCGLNYHDAIQPFNGF